MNLVLSVYYTWYDTLMDNLFSKVIYKTLSKENLVHVYYISYLSVLFLSFRQMSQHNLGKMIFISKHRTKTLGLSYVGTDLGHMTYDIASIA